MSAGKISLLVIYAILAALALTQGASALGIWSLRILVVLAVVHAIECAVFFSLVRKAGGSLPVHMLNLFLFGVLHVKDVREQGSQEI